MCRVLSEHRESACSRPLFSEQIKKIESQRISVHDSSGPQLSPQQELVRM